MIMRRAKILTGLILMALCLPINLPAANTCKAASTPGVQSKISPELAERIRSDDGFKRVRVVIQLDDPPANEIHGLLSGLGAKVKRRLNQLKMHVVELPLNAVEMLASRHEVRYISPDRQIAPLGHLEDTTGTAAARVQTTTSPDGLVTTTSVFDGRGVAIAIVDSGIDENHASFRDENGVSRVIARQDFTGENRTDDPYGHGTHVASLAAGNDQISNGAYTGIAPRSSLVNLRILDSHGLGS